jgi:hypothetical protein
MSFQSYLDNIKAKTGKTPEDFIKLAKEKGLTTHAEIVAWLKADYDLGTGHARAIVHVIQGADKPRESKEEGIDKHFTGGKAGWRKPYDDLLAKLKAFGSDVRVAPTSTYLSLLRGDKKFGVVAVTSKGMDIGIKLKGAPAEGRFEAAGDWNSMVTHRVRISDAAQIDADVLDWLRQAYEKAK